MFWSSATETKLSRIRDERLLYTLSEFCVSKFLTFISKIVPTCSKYVFLFFIFSFLWLLCGLLLTFYEEGEKKKKEISKCFFFLSCRVVVSVHNRKLQHRKRPIFFFPFFSSFLLKNFWLQGI